MKIFELPEVEEVKKYVSKRIWSNYLTPDTLSIITETYNYIINYKKLCHKCYEEKPNQIISATNDVRCPSCGAKL